MSKHVCIPGYLAGAIGAFLDNLTDNQTIDPFLCAEAAHLSIQLETALRQQEKLS